MNDEAEQATDMTENTDRDSKNEESTNLEGKKIPTMTETVRATLCEIIMIECIERKNEEQETEKEENENDYSEYKKEERENEDNDENENEYNESEKFESGNLEGTGFMLRQKKKELSTIVSL